MRNAVVTVGGAKSPVPVGRGESNPLLAPRKRVPGVLAGKRCCCSSSGDPGLVKGLLGALCHSRETDLKNKSSAHQL